jgi:hypothetical protein
VRQLEFYGKGSGVKKLHENTRRRLVAARDMRRCMPSYEWMRRQAAGWAREIRLCWDAIDRREVWQMTHKGGSSD